MSLMQSLFVAATCSVAVALLEWRVLRRMHGRTLASLKERYRYQDQAATKMLTQCRRQIHMLQAEVANARALSLRRSLHVVGGRHAPAVLQVEDRADHGWPAGASHAADAFADTRADDGLALLASARRAMR